MQHKMGNINSVNKLMQASIPLTLFCMTNPAEWGPTFSLYMALSGWRELQNVEKRKKGTLPHRFYRLFWMRRLVHAPYHSTTLHTYTHTHTNTIKATNTITFLKKCSYSNSFSDIKHLKGYLLSVLLKFKYYNQQ